MGFWIKEDAEEADGEGFEFERAARRLAVKVGEGIALGEGEKICVSFSR